MQPLENLGLIPMPMHCQPMPGCLPIDASTRLVLASDEITRQQARAILPTMPIGTMPVRAGSILLTTDGAKSSLGREGYRLVIRPDGVTLTATATSGFLHGLQTLRQLCRNKAPGSIPCCVIHDRPRFRWRGMHLDVCRHFFDAAQIKRFLDLMALHKFNTFHWHLTDDQGWRIAIDKWPKLTSVGAWRDHGESRYGGFYSKQEIREVVRHAHLLGITIVPEIEIPGHAQAAIAAYPWLGNSKTELAVRVDFNASPHIYAVSDATLAFLEDCLLEVIDMFPGPFIHIGGDECCKDEWRASPVAQQRILSEGLADADELLTWFVDRIGTFLAPHDRRIIGWDEIYGSKLSRDTSIMVWHGAEQAGNAVRAGHDVVMAPSSHCYFDYYQGERDREPLAFDGDLSLATVYQFDPIPNSLDPTESARILGSQGNLWTEHIKDWNHLMYMTYPRACAMAEVLWSPPETRDFSSFMARWQQHAQRLGTLGVNYRPSD